MDDTVEPLEWLRSGASSPAPRLVWHERRRSSPSESCPVGPGRSPTTHAALVSLKPDLPRAGAFGERALGFFHLGTGIWLLYMMFAVTVDFTFGYHWLV